MSSNISVIDGTVRGFEQCLDGKSIKSVVVRDLEGNNFTLNDVALVAGLFIASGPVVTLI